MRLAGERANDIAPSESDSNVVALNTFVSQIFISAVDSGADDAGTSFGNFIQPEIKHKRKQLIPPASGNDMHGFVSLSLSLSCFSCLFLFPLYAFYPTRFPFPVFSKFTIPRCSTVRWGSNLSLMPRKDSNRPASDEPDGRKRVTATTTTKTHSKEKIEEDKSNK